MKLARALLAAPLALLLVACAEPVDSVPDTQLYDGNTVESPGPETYVIYCEHAVLCLENAGVPSAGHQADVDQCTTAAANAAAGLVIDLDKLACLATVPCALVVTCGTTNDCSGLTSYCQ